jgi:hypothetical protein
MRGAIYPVSRAGWSKLSRAPARCATVPVGDKCSQRGKNRLKLAVVRRIEAGQAGVAIDAVDAVEK